MSEEPYQPKHMSPDGIWHGFERRGVNHLSSEGQLTPGYEPRYLLPYFESEHIVLPSGPPQDLGYD